VHREPGRLALFPVQYFMKPQFLRMVDSKLIEDFARMHATDPEVETFP